MRMENEITQRADDVRSYKAEGACATLDIPEATRSARYAGVGSVGRRGETRREDTTAAPQRRDPDLEALIRRGTAEIVRLNPHIGAPSPTFTDEEIAEIQRGDAALAALWDSPEGQRAQALGYSAADTVDADRGE